jgi:polyisoprenoid-binding protein YceI
MAQALSSKANAAPENYIFDKTHTQILFFADHLGFSMSQGEFHDYDGEIIFDEESPEKSYVRVNIKTASIDMDDDRWNEHMKSADFFYVTEFPEMSFESNEIKITGENEAEITGDLTLLGITNPVKLYVRHNKTGEHPMTGNYISGFSARGKIKRSDFGMTYGLPGVGDQVNLRLEVEAIRQ